LPLLIFFITKFPSVALLKRQGFNFKSPAKAAPVKQEPQPQIDCTGNLQVSEHHFSQKILLPDHIQLLLLVYHLLSSCDNKIHILE